MILLFLSYRSTIYYSTIENLQTIEFYINNNKEINSTLYENSRVSSKKIAPRV